MVVLTLGMRHIVLLFLLAKVLEVEISYDVDDLHFSAIFKIIGILTLSRSVGTFKLKRFSTLGNHGAVNFPQAVANILDIVDVGEDLVASVDILLSGQLHSYCVGIYARLRTL